MNIISINALVSVCSSSDLDIWRISSIQIIEKIESESYIVIVPTSEIKKFKKKTPSEFRIISEDDYVGNLKAKISSRLLSGHNSVGWYLQQFIKLSFLYHERNEHGISLIWDADTVPLKKISFFDNNKINYYTGYEFHEPYFHTINRLLGFQKQTACSFIGQCMPCPNIWTRDFFNYLELRFNSEWSDAILDSIDFGHFSSFSEYETLGTFFYKKYNEFISLKEPSIWQRRGKGLVGRAENLKFTSWFLKFKYDFIAFEKWDNSFSCYTDFKERLINKIF